MLSYRYVTMRSPLAVKITLILVLRDSVEMLRFRCQATAHKLISHVVADHSAIDPTYVEDLLLTYKTFIDRPSEICSHLLNWFLEKRFRDKVGFFCSTFKQTHNDAKKFPALETHRYRFFYGFHRS